MKINELTLFTTNLIQQKHFYTKVLELPLVISDEEKFTVKIGVSSLTFITSENTNPAHFAINISSYKIKEALSWKTKYRLLISFQGGVIETQSNLIKECLFDQIKHTGIFYNYAIV